MVREGREEGRILGAGGVAVGCRDAGGCRAWWVSRRHSRSESDKARDLPRSNPMQCPTWMLKTGWQQSLGGGIS